MSFQETLDTRLSGAIPESEFVSKTASALGQRGFRNGNSIACVGVCRDELCRTLHNGVREYWGAAFKFTSLAGMLFLGKTGFGAAHHHAPNEEGRERYVYFAMPHIGIGEDGNLGACERLHRPGASTACGALAAFLGDLNNGQVNTSFDPDDVEQSLLKARMVPELAWGKVPDLLELTQTAHSVILSDLERMIELTVDTDIADYAVLSGIQVHGPGNAPWVWPGTLYTNVKGQRETLALA